MLAKVLNELSDQLTYPPSKTFSTSMETATLPTERKQANRSSIYKGEEKTSSSNLKPVAPLGDFPPPSSKRQLQRFLGMAQLYHRFVPHSVDTILPLTNLLSGAKGSFELSADALAALDKVRAVLVDSAPLKHFFPNALISLMVSASDVVIGAFRQQHLAGQIQPLAFFSRKLLPAETCYSTLGRKLLAVFLPVKHFRRFLEGREFTVFTDHKPLFFALKSSSDELNPREIRQSDYSSQFTSDIRHI
nr:unnamed protein product [Spirometra erinaceieuropaei]